MCKVQNGVHRDEKSYTSAASHPKCVASTSDVFDYSLLEGLVWLSDDTYFLEGDCDGLFVALYISAREHVI